MVCTQVSLYSHTSPILTMHRSNLLSDHLTQLIHIFKQHVVVGHGPERGFQIVKIIKGPAEKILESQGEEERGEGVKKKPHKR